MSQEKAAPNTKRSRGNTRAALLRATEELLVQAGPDAVSIDTICARAGFTRGAFYSNFRTVSDVYYAVYEIKTAEGLEFIRRGVKAAVTALESGAGPRATLNRLLEVLPGDTSWLTLRAMFVAGAQADPELAATLRAEADDFVAGVVPLVQSLADSFGVRLRPDADGAARVLITAYLGAVMQAPLAEDPAWLLRETTMAAWRGVLA